MDHSQHPNAAGKLHACAACFNHAFACFLFNALLALCEGQAEGGVQVGKAVVL